MSFNNNHNNPLEITPTNYEEYFLLYIDDELSPEEKKAVEAFVLLHPELKEELDLLLETKLPAEVISLGDKESLMAEEMKANAWQEQLLLYIDDELNAEEKKLFENELSGNAALQKQYSLLQKTKSNKAEIILYPSKNELYRHTEKRAALPVYWMRIAAAVLVILFAGLFFWMAQERTQSQQPIAVQSQQAQPHQEPHVFDDEPPVPFDSAAIAHPVQKDYLAAEDKKKEYTEEATHINNKALRNVKTTPQEPIIREIARNTTNPIKEPLVKQKDVLSNSPAKDETPDVAINKIPVTSDTPPAYSTTEASANNPKADFAVNKEERKGGTLKTILRKATRFIERRTGIQTTNEDDELLIGAVAIKL
ncbi:MAG: hypothetical protein ICV79_08080 [Flavisolibacter sp.]|nr:hypothetical protein [Flavisolibacter sp.]